jgi:hypothetical protein
MYWPEANVLVPTTTDPDSKTPAFKCVLISVESEGQPPLPNGFLHEQADETIDRVPLELLHK